MRKLTRWAYALAISLLAASAAASPATDAVSATRTAIQARVAAPETPESEARKLNAADAALARVDGSLDADDVTALASAAKNVARSRTADASVLAGLVDIAECLADAVDARDAEIVADLAGVFAPGEVARVQARLGAVRTLLEEARALIATDPAGATLRLRRVLRRYVGVENLLASLLARLNAPLPLTYDKQTNAWHLVNNTGRDIIVQSAAFDVVVTPDGGSPQTFRFGGNSHLNDANQRAPFRLIPGGYYIVADHLSALVMDEYGFPFAFDFRVDGAVRLKLDGRTSYAQVFLQYQMP